MIFTVKIQDVIIYLVFDSKFTTYQNLKKLDSDGVKFITIRRRGKKRVEDLAKLPKEDWQTVRVEAANGKKRLRKVSDSTLLLNGYG